MKARRTRSQECILNVLQTLDRAISAQDLYIELRNQGQSMGLATVYRSLEALKLAGVVQARTLGSGESLYSLLKEDKHHFTCLQCGSSIPINECPVHELEQELNTSHNFKIYYHMLEFFGLCPQCQVTQISSEM